MAKVENDPSSQPVRCARPGPVCPRVNSLPFSCPAPLLRVGAGGFSYRLPMQGSYMPELLPGCSQWQAPLSDWLV